MLTAFLLLPAAGAVSIAFLPAARQHEAKYVALFFSALAFLRLPRDAGSELSGRVKLREGVATNATTVKDAAAE